MVKPDNKEIAKLFDAAAETYDSSSNLYTMRRRVEALATMASGRCLELGGGAGAVTAGIAASDVNTR